MRYPQRRQRGYILVLTLWMMAAFMIAAAYFARSVDEARLLLEAAEQNNRERIVLMDAETDIMFRLGVSRITGHGLGEGADLMAMDSRYYQGSGVQIALQDERGLLRLNRLEREQFSRLLGVFGVPSRDRNILLDRLADYKDADEYRHLNGAELREYKAAGLPGPPNRELRNPYELKSVLGWSAYSALWEDGRFIELLSTSDQVALNPNTAPWEVLATLPGVTEEAAKAVITRREMQPIAHGGDFSAITGVPEEQLLFKLIYLPADEVAVNLHVPGASWIVRYNVRLTPNGRLMPWQLRNYMRLPLPPGHVLINETKFPPLPPRPAAAALVPVNPLSESGL